MPKALQPTTTPKPPSDKPKTKEKKEPKKSSRKAVTVLTKDQVEKRKTEARDLDQRINVKIDKFSREVAKAYIDLGRDLTEMQKSKGYLEVGFSDWGKYLESKQDRLGKTYCYYVMRLAKAENLDQYIEKVSAAQLIEYSKLVKGPNLPKLIADTWEAIAEEGMSARKTEEFLKKHVAAHPGVYKKLGTGGGKGRPGASWFDKIGKQHADAKSKGKESEFLEGLKAYLDSLREEESR